MAYLSKKDLKLQIQPQVTKIYENELKSLLVFIKSTQSNINAFQSSSKNVSNSIKKTFKKNIANEQKIQKKALSRANEIGKELNFEIEIVNGSINVILTYTKEEKRILKRSGIKSSKPAKDIKKTKKTNKVSKSKKPVNISSQNGMTTELPIVDIQPVNNQIRNDKFSYKLWKSQEPDLSKLDYKNFKDFVKYTNKTKKDLIQSIDASSYSSGLTLLVQRNKIKKTSKMDQLLNFAINVTDDYVDVVPLSSIQDKIDLSKRANLTIGKQAMANKVAETRVAIYDYELPEELMNLKFDYNVWSKFDPSITKKEFHRSKAIIKTIIKSKSPILGHLIKYVVLNLDMNIDLVLVSFMRDFHEGWKFNYYSSIKKPVSSAPYNLMKGDTAWQIVKSMQNSIKREFKTPTPPFGEYYNGPIEDTNDILIHAQPKINKFDNSKYLSPDEIIELKKRVKNFKIQMGRLRTLRDLQVGNLLTNLNWTYKDWKAFEPNLTLKEYNDITEILKNTKYSSYDFINEMIINVETNLYKNDNINSAILKSISQSIAEWNKKYYNLFFNNPKHDKRSYYTYLSSSEVNKTLLKHKKNSSVPMATKQLRRFNKAIHLGKLSKTAFSIDENIKVKAEGDNQELVIKRKPSSGEKNEQKVLKKSITSVDDGMKELLNGLAFFKTELLSLKSLRNAQISLFIENNQLEYETIKAVDPTITFETYKQLLIFINRNIDPTDLNIMFKLILSIKKNMKISDDLRTALTAYMKALILEWNKDYYGTLPIGKNILGKDKYFFLYLSRKQANDAILATSWDKVKRKYEEYVINNKDSYLDGYGTTIQNKLFKE